MIFEIKPIQPHQTDAAKRVVYTVAKEIFGDQEPLEELIAICEARHELEDMDDIQRNYFENGGIFMVTLDGERVIGTGAIRRLDDDVCELKRLWLLIPYQGKGLGYRMIQELLDIARKLKYKKIRLETDSVYQNHALAFYRKLGFYDIPKYGEYDDDVALEMIL